PLALDGQRLALVLADVVLCHVLRLSPCSVSVLRYNLVGYRPGNMRFLRGPAKDRAFHAPGQGKFRASWCRDGPEVSGQWSVVRGQGGASSRQYFFQCPCCLIDPFVVDVEVGDGADAGRGELAHEDAVFGEVAEDGGGRAAWPAPSMPWSRRASSRPGSPAPSRG